MALADHPDQFGDSQAIQSIVEPEEEVIWLGHPDPMVLVSPQDAVLIPVSAILTLMAGWMMYGAIDGGAPIAFKGILGIVAVFVLYCDFGRFGLKWYRRRSTVYAITSKRIVVADRHGRLIEAISNKSPIERVECQRDGGHGSIKWGRDRKGAVNAVPITPSAFGYWAAGSYWPSWSDGGVLGFYNVADFSAMKETALHLGSTRRKG